MKIINNSDRNIMVEDIGFSIPITKMGVMSLDENIACKSNDLILLIKSGKVSVYFNNEVAEIINGDSKSYLIPGFCIWEGEGKTKPCKKFSDDVSRKSISGTNAIDYLLSIKKIENKYKIRKRVDSNVSIESLKVVLTKSNPEKTLLENQFNNKDVLKAISSGLIEIVESNKSCIDNKPEKKEDKIFNRPLGNTYSRLQCFWEGPIFDSGGYANMNREYLIHLTNLGVRIVPSIVQTSNDIEEKMIKQIFELNLENSKYVNKKSPKVYATNVPCKHSGQIIAYTMMETENGIHKDLSKHFEIADEIWVPCDWNRETFKKGGVKSPIRVMPLGVNSDIYAPRERVIEYSFPTKNFVFYSSSTWIWRKGFDVLLRAYSRAFTADDDVTLIIFTKVPGIALQDMKNKIINDIHACVDKKGSLPHLVIINCFLPTFMMPYLYNSIDCFVLFSRGEGWGLPYCEATSSGVPVIGADHGGQKMFLNENNSFLVKPDMISQCHPKLLYMSPFYKGMVFADYSEKAIKKASEAMRCVYENQSEAKKRAELCRNELLEKYTWDKCALRVADRLKEIS